MQLAVTDLWTRVTLAAGDINSDSGTLHSRLTPAESVEYIERVFEDYKLYGRFDRFFGSVAEVGPGDSCGVALLCLQDGADRVDLVDRFYSQRNTHDQAAIYRALSDVHDGVGCMLSKANLEDETTFQRLQRHYGAAAAAEAFFSRNRSFDFIVSRAVLEHLYDPLAAIQFMISALNPGGRMLHKVDLRDHLMYSFAHHELKYLEVPSALYGLLTRGSGRPNRVLFHRYKQAFERADCNTELLVTRLAGVGDITPHVPYLQIDPRLRKEAVKFVASVRSNFAHEFRAVSSEDLSVTGVFIVSQKNLA
jgi:SAM-dependent methyltransferase